MKELLNLVENLITNLDSSITAKEFDFTKKEDINQLDNAIKELKESPLIKLFITDDTLDSISKKAHQIYDKSVKEKQLQQPSKHIDEKIKNQITNLATEYVNKVILPNSVNGIDGKKYKNIVDSLVDFVCWIYKK